jgi:hypothetical protein
LACAWAFACAGTAGVMSEIEIAMMQVAAAARQRKRLTHGIFMAPESGFRNRATTGAALWHYSFKSSRRRLVWARETGISLARLSFIFNM